MRKIKVGEYIRFYKGSIVKCTEWDVNYYNDFIKGKFHLYIDNKKEKIVKHSFDIIDLVQVRRLCEWEINSLCIEKSKKRRNYDFLWEWKTY